jgi:hypothetical protein
MRWGWQFWWLPQDSSRSYSMITDAHRIHPGQRRYADVLFEKWQAPEDWNRWVS